jgi:hypothetical protein
VGVLTTTRGERHVLHERIKDVPDVTVDDGWPGAVPPGARSDTDRKERIMPHLDIGAVRATIRSAWRRLDTWTLRTLNHPAGGYRPR